MKTGILLTNLGSPDAPTKQALKKYLKEFLWDKRVVDVFRPLWWLILNGIILNTRPKKSAKLYEKIWTPDGSPLIVISKKQKIVFENLLKSKSQKDYEVELGMRYGNPSIEKAYLNLMQKNCDEIFVFPLYPQFSYTTTGSTADVIKKILTQQKDNVPKKLHTISSYASHGHYIQALADSIRHHWQHHQRADKLIFSYHGLPQRYVKNGDPYFHQCLETTRLVVENLGLSHHEWKMVFQSRFGKEPWLKPYADEVLENYPEQGVKSVQVICPAFSADCLETLEEIQVEYKNLFLEAGGERFEYIPALNDQPFHIEALVKIFQDHSEF